MPIAAPASNLTTIKPQAEFSSITECAMNSHIEMSVHPTDRERIRDLARQVMEVARLPCQNEKRTLWTRLNRLQPVRPMVWINEIPWDEIQDDELRPLARDDFSRKVESDLRTTLYLWRHMRTDMVLDPIYYTDYVYSDTGYGMDMLSSYSEGEYGIGSRDYIPTIKTDEDIARIQMPRIQADWTTTERNFERVCDLIGDLIPVQKRGVGHMWCAPWDQLIQWWGIEELMTDMVDRPAFVHRGISRMMDAFLGRLQQLEAQGLLSISNGNHRVGSGGLGITDELPQADYDGSHARPIDQWGTSTGQIFAAVGPAMHDEFCLQHELRWLEQFGLNCYGCCEPLHRKVGMLRKIPRLRRVSMSTWINIDKGVQEIGRDYIFSYKPNPAVFAWDHWNLELARRDLVNVLGKTRGCVVELIMKDISTCRHQPQRIWEWCDMAMRVVEDYA